MADEGRSRRAARPASKAAGALAKLREIRSSGAKHGAIYDIKEEEKVYDVVEEDEYADIVARRRGEGGDFIDDDDGMGYVEVGEEDYWEGEGEDAEKSQDEPVDKGKKRKKADKDSKGARKKQLSAPTKAAKQSINKLFSAATAKVATLKNDPETSQAADALLDDILTDLGGSVKPSRSRPRSLAPAGPSAAARPGAASAARPQTGAWAVARPHLPAARTHLPAAGARPGRTALAGTAASRLSKALRDVPMLDATVKDEEMGYDDHGGIDYNNDYNDDYNNDYGGDEGTDAGMPDDPPLDEPQGTSPSRAPHPVEAVSASKAEEESTAAPRSSVNDSAEAPTPTPNRTVQQLKAQEEGTPAASASGGSAPKTPWRTPPPTFAEVATPLTAVAASGWQQHYDDDDDDAEAREGGPDGVDEAAEEAKEEWVDDGSLPLVDNTLPFFLLDAHEEQATPGTVYLFGKVPNGGQHQSCCAVVEGCMRCIFFVPRPGTFAGADLAPLEAEAASNPGAKGPLLRHLHEQAADLKAEVRGLLAEHGIDKYVIKPVRRNYAFELETVPHGEQWVLKVRYSAAKPSLPLGLEGEHFVGAFGAQQSVLESVLLKRRVMGPSWISLHCPTRVDSSKQVSWCKLEVRVEGHKNISAKCPGQQETPPLVVAALNLKTSLHPQANTNEVVAASVVYLPAVNLDRPLSKAAWNSSRSLRHFSVLRKLDGQPFPAGFEAAVAAANASEMGRRNGGCMLSAQASERSLLMNLLARLRQLDADILVGHNIAAFDLDVLLHRLQHHKVPQWSRIGRLKRSAFPNLGSGGGHSFGGGAGPGLLAALAGRLICDTYLGARELLHEVDYTMATLARIHLGQTRSDLSASDVPGKYEATPKLMELVQHTESDAWLALSLAMHLNLLPLTRQLSCLSGSLWSRTFQGQRAQRIEMLLLHEFHARKFLLPDKLSGRERERQARRQHAALHGDDGEEFEEVKAGGKKGKAQYAGGLVLEPKKGLYNSIVLVLDFNSLYPSIIQEYNICFTTVRRPKDGCIAPLPEPSHDLAVLPKVIRGLVQRRREVKALLGGERDPVRRQQLDIRQQALKLTANSMYGCLGFSASRFFARPLAELVTAQGRDILQSTVDLVQSSVGLEVIYGDTDSIMVRTDSSKEEDARALGARVKREVNKRYKLLEIELDAMYKCMLLLKKKKYAAIKLDKDAAGRVVEVKEAKGLDMVRRDWCALAKDVGNYALDEILSGRPAEDVVDAIHARLRQVREKVDAGAVTLDKFVIHKQLTKRPEDYPDAKNQPHVRVALRRAAAHKRDGTRQGETVPYIICVEVDEDGQPKEGSSGLAERAYHRDELASNPALRVDVQYYLANQVHPVVSRLCAPIEGTDAARLADCLGLDPAKYHAAAASAGSGLRDALEDALIASTAMLDSDARYKDCDPLWLTGSDGTRFAFVGVQDIVSGKVAGADAFAPPDAAATGAGLSAAQVANQVRLRAREAVAKYYEGTLVSDDEVMPVTTRNICLRAQGDAAPGTASPNVASAGNMAAAMSEAALYTQLSHFHRLLDPSLALSRLKDDAERLEATRRLAPITAVLEAGRRAAEQLRDRCAHRWVNLSSLYNVTATGA